MGPAGHLAAGLVAKRFAPKVPLFLLLIAPVIPDLLGFVFRVIGIENYANNVFDPSLGAYITLPMRRYWSHGLFMNVVWSALAALLAYLVWRDRRTSAVIGLTVFSHWVFDFIVHPPDLPLLFAGSPKVGLGLWATRTGFMISILLEIILFAGGIAIYLNSRKTTRKY
jgi:hypothetical protein